MFEVVMLAAIAAVDGSAPLDMAEDAIVNNSIYLESILGVLALAWTLFRSSEWWKGRKDSLYYKAVMAVEAGVEHTYRNYVRQLKLDAQDGRLTDQERAKARELAKHVALQYSGGINLMNALNGQLDLELEKAVRRLKNQEAE